MGLLDDTKAKREGKKHENPLANHNIKKEKLPATSLRLDGDTHAKILALKNVVADRNLNNMQIITEAVDNMVSSLDEESLEIFNKYYHINIEEKVDILKRKGQY